MNVKKLLLATVVVLLGVALFFAGTSLAQSDEGNVDQEWSEMMDGRGWEHGSMHDWDNHSEHAAECPEYGEHADEHADHMDGWDGWEDDHHEMHGAYGHMMGDWGQPEGDQDAPAEDSGQ